MDSYRQRQMTYIQPKQYCLQLHTCTHLLRLRLQGFSVTLPADCEIRSNCGKRFPCTRDLFAQGWDLVIFDDIFYWFVLNMRMQVILESPFARLGSAHVGGGKKGEFRDWTSRSVIPFFRISGLFRHSVF